MIIKKLITPISDEAIRDLHCGEQVLLNGVIVTGRDAAHKWITDAFIRKTQNVSTEDHRTLASISKHLKNGVIYHCGPIVSQDENGVYSFVAAGPTTSIREEPYQGDVMRLFNAKAVIGKGGMGSKTLQACENIPCVYLHAVGGCAASIAACVKNVIEVHKLEFGVPEAMWIIEVEDFPLVVTMDAHGKSLHEEVEKNSHSRLSELMKKKIT